MSRLEAIFASDGRVALNELRSLMNVDMDSVMKILNLTVLDFKTSNPRLGKKTKKLFQVLSALEVLAGGSEEKMVKWLHSPNPRYGFSAPINGLLAGKLDEILAIIEQEMPSLNAPKTTI